MEVRECTADDVIGLLHCASDDKEIYGLDMFDDWQQYQKWVLDCIYNKSCQVLVVDDGFGVIGFLVWSLTKVYYKWLAYLDYIYVGKDHRKGDTADKLVIEFIHNCYNSSAQRLKFDTRVLPSRWVDAMALDSPIGKYDTYYATRTEELKEWYNTIIRPLKES